MENEKSNAVRRPAVRGDLIEADLCVIGGGSGGLSVAAAAVQMGASTVLVERGAMGGECLNTGCVPSKALLAAAHAAHAARAGVPYGIAANEPVVDFPAVHRHVRAVISAIAPHDSVARFEGLGVMVVQASARFVSPDEVEAGGQRIRARRFVVATGSKAAIPPIRGLTEVPVLTNETIFDLAVCPSHLVIIGGGPIGVEMAQAFRRLGARVTVLEAGTILGKDDPDAVALVRQALLTDGVTLMEQARIAAVRPSDEGIEIEVTPSGEAMRVLTGTHLLVATGRSPQLDGLGLETAKIAYTSKGITVDDRLRTTNRRVFAIGDVATGPQFTHWASYQAGIVIRNALFAWPAKVQQRTLPWATYTDPELAQVGITEAEARKAGEDITVLVSPFAENDRGQAERQTAGFVKVVASTRGRILGVTIVGAHAGELIGAWGLAMSAKLKLSSVAGAMFPYPTRSEASKRAAGSYYAPTLYGQAVRFVVGLLQRALP